jgi:acyl-CoA synthetase (AMP-forming)/AMP-acid ligase II
MTEIPQRLLGEALVISSRKYPDKTAVIVKSSEYTYSDLKSAAEQLSKHLLNSGIRRGDRVAVYMNNSCIV